MLLHRSTNELYKSGMTIADAVAPNVIMVCKPESKHPWYNSLIRSHICKTRCLERRSRKNPNLKAGHNFVYEVLKKLMDSALLQFFSTETFSIPTKPSPNPVQPPVYNISRPVHRCIPGQSRTNMQRLQPAISSSRYRNNLQCCALTVRPNHNP